MFLRCSGHLNPTAQGHYSRHTGQRSDFSVGVTLRGVIHVVIDGAAVLAAGAPGDRRQVGDPGISPDEHVAAGEAGEDSGAHDGLSHLGMLPGSPLLLGV
jgi:hypothetical protein